LAALLNCSLASALYAGKVDLAGVAAGNAPCIVELQRLELGGLDLLVTLHQSQRLAHDLARRGVAASRYAGFDELAQLVGQ